MEEKNAKRRKKQISFEVEDHEHHQIKSAASARNISINKWIMRAVEKQLVEERRVE